MENEFHSRYDNLLPNDACWIWHGRSFNGHPVMRVANGFVYAHRVAYAIGQGIHPSDIWGEVVHTCPNHLCVNPTHLELSNVTCTIPKEA